MVNTANRLRVRISSIAQEGHSQRAFTLAPCDDASLPSYAVGAYLDGRLEVNLGEQLLRTIFHQ